MHKNCKNTQELLGVKNHYWKERSTKAFTSVNPSWGNWPSKVVYLSEKLTLGFYEEERNWSLKGGKKDPPVVSTHPYTHKIKTFNEYLHMYMHLETCVHKKWLYIRYFQPTEHFDCNRVSDCLSLSWWWLKYWVCQTLLIC